MNDDNRSGAKVVLDFKPSKLVRERYWGEI